MASKRKALVLILEGGKMDGETEQFINVNFEKNELFQKEKQEVLDFDSDVCVIVVCSQQGCFCLFKAGSKSRKVLQTL